MSVLVIAEHDHKNLKPATLHVVTAARAIDPSVIVCIVGDQIQKIGEEAQKIEGVEKILLLSHPALKNFLAEPVTEALKNIAATYSHILAPSTTFAKNFMPRLAALLGVGQISDVMAVESPSVFQRPIYAGNAIATVESSDPIKVMTVRTTTFPRAPVGKGSATLETVSLQDIKETGSTYVDTLSSVSARPELTAARVVVSGGRGLQSKDNFKIIEELADLLGAAIGASRAAVDAGYISNDHQVGQTGKVVAPELYIAVGISGAIQHLAGMKDSKIIVAINKDEDAPIFQIADFALVGDLFHLIPELNQALRSLKAKAS